jgi:metal-responsive CopG/Arc/MetJ family transcriptional regulator
MVLEMVLKERGYRQVSLPIPLIERIEKYISNHKEEGFTSIPEFIRQAIREKIDRSAQKEA